MDPIKRKALEAISGLTVGDCLAFFDHNATVRDQKIAAMVDTKDESFEVDNNIVSEGPDNGAYVLGWRWVTFEGTEFDKHLDD